MLAVQGLAQSREEAEVVGWGRTLPRVLHSRAMCCSPTPRRLRIHTVDSQGCNYSAPRLRCS